MRFRGWAGVQKTRVEKNYPAHPQSKCLCGFAGVWPGWQDNFRKTGAQRKFPCADALEFGKCIEDGRHGNHHRAAHAEDVRKQLGPPVDGFVLRVAAHALAIEPDSHFAERSVAIHIPLHAHAVPPFPPANAAEPRRSHRCCCRGF